MKTVAEILTLSAQFLKEKGCPRYRRDAEDLLAHALKLKRLDLYMQHDQPIQEKELEILRGFLSRAGKGEPIEYMTGEVPFYDCAIEVGPAVLIPRPETEILVDQACKSLRSSGEMTAWDICTGSGCIGIAVKKACPHLQLSLSDISDQALRFASRNAKKNSVDVEILKGDLLAPFAGRKADVIFCNPPYISSKEFLALDRSVKDFEPEEALIGGEDGFSFYQRLAEGLPDYLHPHAKIFFEIGGNQGEAVLKLFSGNPWKNARVEKDWGGKDRFFFLEFE
jgi:release factor glutamine methyltransferase